MISKVFHWLNQQAFDIFTIAAIALLVIALLSSAHAATTATRKHDNSLGVVVYRDNPNQYLEGAIAGGSVHADGKREFTTIRVNPSHTFMLFTQDITFCGDQSNKLSGMTGDVVLTYSRVMHETWCFDLYSVHQVKEITPQ
jgi:hypothetical protein